MHAKWRGYAGLEIDMVSGLSDVTLLLPPVASSAIRHHNDLCLSVMFVVQVCKEVQASHGKLLKDWIKGIQGESLNAPFRAHCDKDLCTGVALDCQGCAWV